jgi:DNA-binding response OmpR family regulator
MTGKKGEVFYMEILLIESNHLLRHSILGRLAEDGYQVTTALTGTKALQLLDTPRYDTILLDTALPDITAIGVLREIRTRGIDTPVMMLSTENRISDRVHALDSGADDFLAMPFHLDELMARIRRMVRTYKRTSAQHDNGIRCLADLTVDTKRQIATRGGKRIPLSAKEFAILEYLIDNQGTTLTRESIEKHVSSQGINSNDSVISVYIHYLRRKIDDGFSLKLLHTIRNEGYVLRADSPSKFLKL